mmetsp:Transcript_1415/g.1911  ORF Transcript_1415/g.1911 Transcript_1415/m.1911 type:complete len:330 (+) Transcript_1415:2451-3440(+)
MLIGSVAEVLVYFISCKPSVPTVASRPYFFSIFGGLYKFNNRDDETTLIDDNAMAKAATYGGTTTFVRGNNAPAAIGIPSVLYPSAHKKFKRIRLKMVLERSNVTITSLSFEFIKTTCADSIATSVPAPIAIPTSALASAGESFTPSPIMATRKPSPCNFAMQSAFSPGSTSAITRLGFMPMDDAIDRAVVRLSPVNMYTLILKIFSKTCTVVAASSFALSMRPITASVFPLTHNTTAVCPLFSRNSIASNVPGRAEMEFASIHFLFPIFTVIPSTVHLIPLPISFEKSATAARRLTSSSAFPIPYSFAFCMIPFARGCSLPFSALAAR